MTEKRSAFTGEFLRTTFDRIFVINLPDRSDRRQHFARQLARIGLSFDDPLVELVEAVRPTDAGAFDSIGARGAFLSHLSVLERAASEDLQSILILEDDIGWTQAAMSLSERDCDHFQQTPWCYLHGGHGDDGHSTARFDLRPLAADEEKLLAHFVGLRAPVILDVRDFLLAMLERPAGSPEGGPMHVDGAYGWFRSRNPEVAGYVCAPSLARQMPSRSDIAEATGVKAMPGVRNLLDLSRRLRNALTRY